VAQTDAKGDRRLRPSEQADPDVHLRVVDRRADGLVVRGAKLHTSCAPYADELVVFPSRRMTDADRDWSVAFAVPVATPGVRLYAADFLAGSTDRFTRPISAEHRMVESLTVFDDVVVPWDRVFFHDRPDLATAAALGFAEYHRFTAVSYKLPYLDALVGAAVAVARANGIDGAAHVRGKLTWLAGFAETVRGLVRAAAERCAVDGDMAVPDAFTTNLAKWTFARDLHAAVAIVQDLAGGLLVTGPSGDDWASDDVRPTLERYLAAAWPAEARLAVMNLVADLTTGPYGGYQAVLAAHAEGSIEAEKLAAFRSYDWDAAAAFALRLAGVGEPPS
jgi:aromatic ring hydroxylase